MIQFSSSNSGAHIPKYYAITSIPLEKENIQSLHTNML